MMKKNILLTVCLAMIGILSMNAQNSIVALHHEGKVTLYAGGATQAAMDASVKGDTLYLSEGMFGGFNVTHGIVVLGSGEKTIVSGDITITGNTEKKDLGDYVFFGLNLLNNFVVNDSVKGFKMNQCQMTNFDIKSGKFVDAAEICMSYIKGMLDMNTISSNHVYGLDVLNSKINRVDYGGANTGAITFLNCNIKSMLNASSKNTFTNCIMGSNINGSFVNCLYQSNSSSATFSNCWKDDDWSFDDDLNCSYSDEELQSKGYLGTDGTIIGITGGVQPYTLELFAPHIVEHKLDVDNVNKTLKVTLKMSSDATKSGE